MTDTTGPGAGQGRLAQLIATRGGLAAPEAPFVIEHREALIYMLCEAAELEHGIMCQYLFAAFSLKQSASEGLSETEVAAVTRWRKRISHVATQEMLHLALVHNLLSAIGAAPHLARPNLPQPANHYPAGVQLVLLPFGERALRHFMFLERPEGMDLDDAEGLVAYGRAAGVVSDRDIVPQGQDFATVGHLYRSIENGFARLAAKYGERGLFVGPPRAQATQQDFRWPELVAVTDLGSAQRAIDTILEQGEGARGDWRDAHFGQFVAILDEYEQMVQANPAFNPVRPVIAANVRPCEGSAQVPLITDPLTARVADLFNVTYEILLQTFERYFAHTEESDAQLGTLADATVALMVRALKPLGDLITTLPAGLGHADPTAGPSFELFYENDYLMPHREAAWALLTERLDEAAWLCAELRAGRGAALAGSLAPVEAALTEIAGTLAAHLPADSPQARRAAQATRPDPDALRGTLAQADELAAAIAAGSADTPLAGQLSALFGTAHAATAAAAASRGPSATAAERLVNSVLRPLADEIRPRPQSGPDGSAQDPAAQPNSGAGSRQLQGAQPSQPQPSQPQPSQPQPSRLPPGVEDPGQAGDLVWQAARSATSMLAALEGACPPGLAEAAAALQQLACDLASPEQAADRLAELWTLQASLPAAIRTAPDGPYLVTNVPQVRNHLGLPVSATSRLDPASQLALPPQLALCRCGGSERKPFCDGSHARNGFTEAKDPKRVPDQRDPYPGPEVTILDNRGLCQHSGFCTDRLATVFRAGQEPFVAPGGGRMDEIIRAVRDCPSGALGVALDGQEQTALRDWGGTREPGIEITRDGPYRVTGAIELAGADGAMIPRNEGASQEHYALCRCGHSQNKPFCSGMHWYVDFRDPALPAEPSLFEWAGGGPALTRMTRLLYERHVPADPLLAPVFAGMPPDHAQREADALAEALGGPPAVDETTGGEAAGEPAAAYPLMLGRTTRRDLTEEQRARWVTLAAASAQEAGLPQDAAFQTALVSYLEWSSRSALAGSPVQTTTPDQPVRSWDWSPAGQPASPPAEEQPAPPVPRPAPGEPVSFAVHIKPLFRERDRQSMSFAFDLWAVDDVRAHAAGILGRLQDGSMPCDGAWPQEQVAVFQRWTESGGPP